MFRTWQTLMWVAAFAASACVYWRATAHCRARFVSSLWLGAALSHFGANLLSGHPVAGSLDQVLELRDATILLLPIGVLAIAPFRESLIALPLGLAVARLGCLPYACCYETPWATLAESLGFVLLHFLTIRSSHPTLLVLSGFGGIRLVAELSGLRVSHGPWLIEPYMVALAWIAIGILLRNRIRSAVNAPEWFTERTRPVLTSLVLMLFVWILFPATAHVFPVHLAVPIAAGIGAATLLVTSPPRRVFEAGNVRSATAGGVIGSGAALLLTWMLPPRFTVMTESAHASLGVAIAVVVLVPVMEELLYRRLLLDDLRALWGPGPAVLGSSLLFALAHVEPHAMIIPFLGGIVSAILVLRTGSLAPSIGLHVGWNTIAIVQPVATPWLAAAGVATCIAACVTTFQRPGPIGAVAQSAR